VSFDLGLTGRRALVTAGTKGVGAAVVDVLHDAGATVVATARAIPADAHTGVQYIAADMTTAAGCATVAQGLLFRIVASLRNHHTTIRMADKNRRAVLSRERPLRGGHVVGERGQRIADGGDPKAFRLQKRGDLRPARVIRKRTMHQHNVLRCGPRRTLYHGATSEETHSQSDDGRKSISGSEAAHRPHGDYVSRSVSSSTGHCFSKSPSRWSPRVNSAWIRRCVSGHVSAV
jgi:hypothetical protein